MRDMEHPHLLNTAFFFPLNHMRDMELVDPPLAFPPLPLNHMRDMELNPCFGGDFPLPLNHMRDMEPCAALWRLIRLPLNHMRDMELNNNTRNERFFNNLN